MAQDPPPKPPIPPFNAKRLGALVKEHREYKNLSQGDLAKAADVAKQAISNRERGTVVPTLTTLAAIGNVLQITMQEFIAAGFGPAPADSNMKNAVEISQLLRNLTPDNQDLAIRQIKGLIVWQGPLRKR
jgi:transcriptional regulator with XRE-family HTH domain